MTGDRPPIPVTADDVGEDFDATASPPPGWARRELTAGHWSEDPGHLMSDDEWAAVVARAEGR